jgi:hypothetical protein
MNEERDDKFDDGRGLEASGHERWVGFQDGVHPPVLGVIVYGAAAVPAHRVLGLLRGAALTGRALGDHAGQRPATRKRFLERGHS